MPMKSEAQRRWMHANKPEMAKRWEKHTPKDKKLPERKKEAHDLGVLLGICQSDQSLETKTVALYKAASESPALMPAAAAFAAEWVLRTEQQHPGFAKEAYAQLEKQATNGATATKTPAVTPKVAPKVVPGSPAAMWGLGKSQMGQKPGMAGKLSKIYSFLQNNQWVLPLAGLALGGLGGGMGGLIGGGLGFMAQQYLPQLAGWGAQQFAPKQWGAFSPQQQKQITGSTDPYGTAKGFVTSGMGRHGLNRVGQALSAPGAAVQRGLGAAKQVISDPLAAVRNVWKGWGAPARPAAGAQPTAAR